jgi:hypothetical protein
MNDRHRLNIKSLANQWSTNDIHAYINGRTKVYPFDAVRILETLLKKSIQDQVEVINNKCYFKNQTAQKFDNGFEQREGFIQALHLSSERVTLNLQTKLTTFYSNISLLDFIHKQIGIHRIPSENDYKKFNELLRNCLIVTQQSNWKKAYEFDRFDSRRPEEIRIETGETLIEYYRDKKQITLTELNYPCIQVYSLDSYNNPCYLPLELCRIKQNQVYNNPIKEEGKQIPTPEERYYKILHTLQDCNYNSRLLCRKIGFKIEDQYMFDFNARILTPPEIKSGCNNLARVKDGRIYLEGQLYKPLPISTLAITYFGTDFKQYKSVVEKFMDKLVEVSRRGSPR